MVEQKGLLSLPLYPKMTGEDVDDVIAAVREIVAVHIQQNYVRGILESSVSRGDFASLEEALEENKLPLLAWPRLLIDSVVEVEEQFVLWRNRHARMTERTIGRRVGTGGSSGVDYLDEAAKGRIFPELWTVRTLLLQREALPELRHPDFYGFAR